MKMSSMTSFLHQVGTEALKLRRSSALHLTWIVPLLFIAVDFLIFNRPALTLKHPTSVLPLLLRAMPIKVVAGLWAGFFHPLLLSVLPALIHRPEHKAKAWKHLHALPISRRAYFLAKASILLALLATSLALLAVGLWIEWRLLAQLNPVVVFAFPWSDLLSVLGWSFLGSIPVLMLYLWLSDRITNAMVPVAFGLIGMVLIISFSGTEVYPSWRRDLIPWILPYACAQHAREHSGVEQEAHAAAKPLPKSRDLSWILTAPREYRLPSGRKATASYSNLPEWLLKPPPPTPAWLLMAFSLGAGVLLAWLGWFDTWRDRP